MHSLASSFTTISEPVSASTFSTKDPSETLASAATTLPTASSSAEPISEPISKPSSNGQGITIAAAASDKVRVTQLPERLLEPD